MSTYMAQVLVQFGPLCQAQQLTKHTRRVECCTSVLTARSSACNKRQANSKRREAAMARLGNTASIHYTDERKCHDHLLQSSKQEWQQP
jgi:hypothetical protein